MDRRRHYLEVALGLFAEHGFNGVSIDQVVAAAGGSKATLYRYFRSKEALFEAIIADLTETTVARRTVDELDALSVEDGLATIGQATARAALSDQATVLFRLATGEYRRFPHLARTLFDNGPAVSYARLQDFLATRVAAGELEIDDLQVAAEQFLGGIVGHLQLRRALGQPVPPASGITARVEAAVAMFMKAYGRPPGPGPGREPKGRLARR